MNKALHREILRLAVPSILAGITVPLVGMVDTAVAGHLAGDSAAFIGAISVGSMVLTLLYWTFGFLRTGTGGLTAQAFGRTDFREAGRILLRGTALALIAAGAAILFQWPFFKGMMLVTDAPPQVKELAERYFFIRIWAAPATMTLMTLRGWFVGLQNSIDSMWLDLIINAVNIGASVLLAFGVGPWQGMGFDGIPLGTVIAQYSGLAFGLWVCKHKYGRDVLGLLRREDVAALRHDGTMRSFFRMNLDLLGRSFFFILIYIGFTMINAGFGELMLACGSIMMQLLMFFSYFTDGFAYAGEALTGRFIGAGDRPMTRLTVRYVFGWSIALGVLFMGLYQWGGMPLVRLLTDDAAVVEACRAYIPWLVLMPVFGCAAFAWDGIYIGATAARGIRNAMLGAAVAFFAVWLLGSRFTELPQVRMHVLLAAYFAHLLMRTVYLTVRYPKDILSK